MKAMMYDKYGPPEVFRLVEVAKPVPKANEILVKVHATTVTSGTLWVRRGAHPDSRLFTLALRLVFGLTRPRKPILGYELSGEVEAVGAAVSRFRPGDQVFGTTTGLSAGAYAEYVCLPETWKQGVVAHKPTNLSHEEAAAVPIGGMTALYLLKRASIQPGQPVLIYGASGSVGTFAVQLAAHHFGAKVTAVCSTANLTLARSLGAETVIDYTQEDFTRRSERYAVVFDAVGKLATAHGKNALQKTGVFRSVKSPTSETPDDLLLLKALVEAGKIRPVIDRCYGLEALAEAHRYVEQGHKKGNVVITLAVGNR
ncbi:MAG: NAD(P)-dependent alcohol dehydrogenase [Chloroflexaceae bacterium]|jgi:NADPH:quinone reductase-like Zn-dependent oxidoreductase|nr:NAD(P)-dependent alcohol dehydrogenase [Chloroflexaceae bacterium]